MSAVHKTEQEKQFEAQQKAAQQAARDQQQAEAQFWASPQGQARAAYARGDKILQTEFEVMTQGHAAWRGYTGDVKGRVTDPTQILNAIAAEGWELVTGSFVFREIGSQSRDKFLSSGQSVEVRGVTVGYYLFRRIEGERR